MTSTYLRLICTAGLALGIPLSAHAHKPWLEPSKTVLSVGQWVTVDAAASTVPFERDHQPMRLDNLTITAPDGSAVAPQNPFTGRLRSVFDLELTQPGTYRIGMMNTNIMASWEEDGRPKRWPPRGTAFTAEGFAKDVPKNAKDLKVTQMLGRIETYVTAGAPSDGALKPSGKGLELLPVTPFNDLYLGEPSTFRFVLDGKPAADLDVELVPSGQRYRSDAGEIKLKTNAKGEVVIQWPQAGLYYLAASVEDRKAEKPATERRTSYAGMFEVLSP